MGGGRSGYPGGNADTGEPHVMTALTRALGRGHTRKLAVGAVLFAATLAIAAGPSLAAIARVAAKRTAPTASFRVWPRPRALVSAVITWGSPVSAFPPGYPERPPPICAHYGRKSGACGQQTPSAASRCQSIPRNGVGRPALLRVGGRRLGSG